MYSAYSISIPNVFKVLQNRKNTEPFFMQTTLMVSKLKTKLIMFLPGKNISFYLNTFLGFDSFKRKNQSSLRRIVSETLKTIDVSSMYT